MSEKSSHVLFNKKVLITYPGRSYPGGVSELYRTADLESENVSYFNIYGSLRNRINFLDTLLMFARFVGQVYKYDLIHINPSLIKNSFFRDGLLVAISKLFGKKVLVYWHGWIDDLENKIKRRSFYRSFFKYTFGHSDISIVLGSVFKNKLREMGYSGPVYIECNCANNRYLEFSGEHKPKSLHRPVRLLFMARMEKTKGAYIAIDTLQLLNRQSPLYELVIAGDGDELPKIRAYAETNKIPGITFTGHVDGLKKHQLFADSDILLFPTYYDEGLPIVLLESMTYGMPVVTRRVGGIPDIIRHGKNGLITESKDPRIFAELVATLCRDESAYQALSLTNAIDSERFSPRRFCQRMINCYNTALSPKSAETSATSS